MIETEDHRNNKADHKQMREDYERSKVLDTCKVLVCLILGFDIDHINNLKVKDLRVLICYHSGSEKLKGIPKKF